ncbi:MAG: PD-(D/E)XK nuclease family protein, partial [Candidatus Paceibacterota bacterium]
MPIIITYLRSSSYATHSMCEQQFFLEYVLGMRSPSNKKADKGTIVHKVLEILAHIKLADQNKEKNIIDDVIGKMSTTKYNLTTIIEKVYNYYSSQFTHHEWELKDYKDCHAWVHKALDSNNGMFDPRNRNILQPEQHFDIEIDREWAKFKYN